MKVRLGTRGSRLALAQSRWVAEMLSAGSDLTVAIEVIRTKGDDTLDRALPEIGGKGLFTLELDRALLDGRVDLAVHSLKDLPTDVPEGLSIACVPRREDPRDVLVGPIGSALTVGELAPGATVGTSSLRRAALLHALHGEVEPRNIRGNVDTRLRKLDDGEYDALVLAAAGLRRLGLDARATEWLDPATWLPAPGQGALGIVTRENPGPLADVLARMHDRDSHEAVVAERTLLARLGGGCQLPLGAMATTHSSGLLLRAVALSPDGRRVVRGEASGARGRPADVGSELADTLLGRGVDVVLEGLEDSLSSLDDASE